MSHKIIIIAGLNGAGKTTFARSFLPQEAHCRRFINADLIAAELHNFDQHYKTKVDAWALYDNAGTAPVLLEWRENT